MILAQWAYCFGFLLRETGTLIFTVSPFLEIGTLIMAEGNYPFQIWAPCLTRGAGFERAAAKSVAFCFIIFSTSWCAV